MKTFNKTPFQINKYVSQGTSSFLSFSPRVYFLSFFFLSFGLSFGGFCFKPLRRRKEQDTTAPIITKILGSPNGRTGLSGTQL